VDVDDDDAFSFVKAVFEEEFGGCDGDGDDDDDDDGDGDGDGVVEIKVDVVDEPGIVRRLAKDEDEEEGGLV